MKDLPLIQSGEQTITTLKEIEFIARATDLTADGIAYLITNARWFGEEINKPVWLEEDIEDVFDREITDDIYMSADGHRYIDIYHENQEDEETTLYYSAEAIVLVMNAINYLETAETNAAAKQN